MAMRPHGAAVTAAVAACLALGPAGCGGNGGGLAGENSGAPAIDIGLLLPDSIGRWETFDGPLIEQAVGERCRECGVETVNAAGSVTTQQRQLEAMITGGAEVLILGPIDAKALQTSVTRAQEAGVPVVAYDRLAEGPISAYVSFDNVQVGRLQGRALLRALGGAAEGAEVVMLNGSPTDPNAELFARGARSVLAGTVEFAGVYDIPGWSQKAAYTTMASAIVGLGPEHIDAVYAANDSLARGAIAALKAAAIEPLPPVTGQDAELTAVQLIVAGEQLMTVYKPFQREAEAAAAMAVALGRGKSLEGIAEEEVANDTDSHIPAVLATPLSLTVDTIEETVVRHGLYTVEEICTPRFESACVRAGLLG